MEENKQLIEPKGSIIEQYVDWWKNGEAKSVDIELFTNRQTFNSSDANIYFNDLNAGELLLDSAFRRLSSDDLYATQTAVILLDKIYSTQLRTPLITANLIHDEIIHGLLDDIKANKATEEELALTVDRIASVIKRHKNCAPKKHITFIYSFATKFCSRICPKEYPVFDGYVAYLLNYYVSPVNDVKLFGNYALFVNTYKQFINKYALGGYSYQQIDRFLWTYGKALSKFAETENAKNKTNRDYEKLSYKADVTYKPPKG